MDAINVSKKDPLARRKELLGQGKGSLSQALIKVVKENVGDLLRNQNGCDIVLELARGGGEDAVLCTSCGCDEDVGALHRAISAEAAEPLAAAAKAEGAGDSKDHILQDYFGSRTIRRLIVYGSDDSKPCSKVASDFSTSLWNDAVNQVVDKLYGTHAEKVLAAMASSAPASVQKECASALKKLLGNGDLKAWVAKFEH